MAKIMPEDGSRSTSKHRRKRQGRVHALKRKPGNQCFTPPPDRIDLNALYGITAQIVARFCPEVGSGEQWVNTAPWFMARQFPLPYEIPGFQPAGSTPLEDFLAKFEGVK